MSEDPSEPPDDLSQALAQCEEQVDHLKKENRLLRDASRTFGALAERLNATLATERRVTDERRAAPRSVPDRRDRGSLSGQSR
jgi:hypothetical protein